MSEALWNSEVEEKTAAAPKSSVWNFYKKNKKKILLQNMRLKVNSFSSDDT